jgi:hypothetical protein
MVLEKLYKIFDHKLHMHKELYSGAAVERSLHTPCHATNTNGTNLYCVYIMYIVSL